MTRGAVERDLWGVLFAVEKERFAQDEKWGKQDHPDIPEWMGDPDNGAFHMPTATDARRRCEKSFNDGFPNWSEILIEEVAEALEEVGDDVKLREELVQVAAVTVAWIEAIDRRAGTQPSRIEGRSDGSSQG